MQSASTDGNFHTTLFSDVDAMMILAPSKTVVRESPDEIEYRFSWYSLLRPLVQKVRKCPATEFFVVATRNADPAYALIYNTDSPTAESIETSRRALESFSSPPQENEESAGGHDAPGGGGGGGFAGQRQPPSDPAVAMLDTNGDGELDEAEVAAASEVLFAADRNSDGKLTREEFPAGPTPPAGRRRPPMDDTEESDIPAAAVETEAAESKTKPGATESPPTVTRSHVRPGSTPFSSCRLPQGVRRCRTECRMSATSRQCAEQSTSRSRHLHSGPEN